jgi:hypothetical protein
MEIGGSFLIQVGVSLTELRLLKDAFSEGFPVEEVRLEFITEER